MKNRLSMRLVITGKLSADKVMDYINRIGDINQDFAVHESWFIDDKNTLRDSLMSMQPMFETCERILHFIGDDDNNDE